MTDLEIMKESWRIHFHDLLSAGGNTEVETTVIEADDEEFEKWVADLENEDDEPEDWEPIEQ